MTQLVLSTLIIEYRKVFLINNACINQKVLNIEKAKNLYWQIDKVNIYIKKINLNANHIISFFALSLFIV